MLTARDDARDLTVRTEDGISLKARWWACPSPRGTLVLAHGLGEHGGAYRHVAEQVGRSLEVDVVAFDFRGHGLSPGRRGVVSRYDDLVADLRSVISWAHARRPDRPVFVLGHSNGGQVALRLALEAPTSLGGVAVSNPSIRIGIQVPAWKLALGKALLALAPWITLKAEAPSEWMTRDPEMQASYRRDGLRHGRISAPLFFGMIEGGEMLLRRAAEIRVPSLLIVGGQDPVISPLATREFFQALGSEDKTLLLYPRMLHEPFNEIGRQQVIEDLIRWLDSRLDPR